MILNSWPFNREAKWRQAERVATQEDRLMDMRLSFMKDEGIKAGVSLGEDVALYHTPRSCSDCGGLFVSDKLTPVTHIVVFSDRTSPIAPAVANKGRT